MIPAPHTEWFAVTYPRWRTAGGALLLAALGIGLLITLPDALDPDVGRRLSDGSRRGRWIYLLPPVPRALLLWLIAGAFLSCAVLFLDSLRHPYRATLDEEGVTLLGPLRVHRIRWSEIARISVVPAKVDLSVMRGAWHLHFELGEPRRALLGLWKRRLFGISLTHTNLKPEGVAAVLRRLNPNLLTIFKHEGLSGRGF